MSVEAVAWAFRVPDLKTSEKITLVGLANFADEYGVCYPRQDTLCERCSLAVRTLRGALSELERRGLIGRLERRRADGSKRSDAYLLIGCPDRAEITTGVDHAILSPQDIVAITERLSSMRQDLPDDDHDTFSGPKGADSEQACGKSCVDMRQILHDQPAESAGIYRIYKSLGNEDETRASAPSFLDFVKEILDAIGHPDLLDRPFWKQEAEKGTFVEAWRGLGLSDAAILEAARSHAADMPELPNGPKGLDRAMARKARGQTGASSSGARLPPDPQAVMKSKADRIKTGRDYLCRDITHSQAIELVAAGLVTAGDCRAVGVRVLEDDPAIEAARAHLAASSAAVSAVGSTERVTLAMKVDFWRARIDSGSPISSNALSAEVRRALVRHGHVTEDDLRRRGL